MWIQLFAISETPGKTMDTASPQPRVETYNKTHHREAHVFLCVLERESRVELSVEDELTLQGQKRERHAPKVSSRKEESARGKSAT